MKIKKVKLLLQGLYARGVYDGQDSVKGGRDRFFGNSRAWHDWEEEQLEKAYRELRALVNKE